MSRTTFEPGTGIPVGIPAVRTYLDPISPRRLPHTCSRVAVFEDGTMMPVLRLLAEQRFGVWDDRLFFPFWVDGDFRNETLDNVELAERTRTMVRRHSRLHVAQKEKRECEATDHSTAE